MGAKPDWKRLEELVADIQRGLDQNSAVEHDVMLLGAQSQTQRQVDVLVAGRVGTVEIKIIIDCKDHRAPADVNAVGQFVGLKNDVGAHAGILVCPSGFTKAAVKLAQAHQISLYRLLHSGDHKWKVDIRDRAQLASVG